MTQNEIITLFNIHEEKQDQFVELNETYSRYSEKATFMSSTVNPATRFINALIYAGVTYMGAVLIVNNGLTVGGLTVFLNYAREYTKPFNDISNVLAELQSALASANRLFEILDGPSEIETGTKDSSINSSIGKVRINYGDNTTKLFNIKWNVIDDTHRSIEYGVYVDKPIDSIDYLSNDETTIYCKKRLELEVGNYYKIKQYLRME